MSPRIAYAALTAVLIAALAFKVAATDRRGGSSSSSYSGRTSRSSSGSALVSRRVSSIHAPSRSTTRFTGTGARGARRRVDLPAGGLARRCARLGGQRLSRPHRGVRAADDRGL